jgi:hypothetical protein
MAAETKGRLLLRVRSPGRMIAETAPGDGARLARVGFQ